VATRFSAGSAVRSVIRRSVSSSQVKLRRHQYRRWWHRQGSGAAAGDIGQASIGRMAGTLSVPEPPLFLVPKRGFPPWQHLMRVLPTRRAGRLMSSRQKLARFQCLDGGAAVLIMQKTKNHLWPFCGSRPHHEFPAIALRARSRATGLQPHRCGRGPAHPQPGISRQIRELEDELGWRSSCARASA
jgi:hypothetical protein